MIAGRCLTCRHWCLPDRHAERVTAARWDATAGRYTFDRETYAVPRAPQIAGRRHCLVLGDHAAPLTAVDSADGTTVETAPEFGCVLWAAAGAAGAGAGR